MNHRPLRGRRFGQARRGAKPPLGKKSIYPFFVLHHRRRRFLFNPGMIHKFIYIKIKPKLIPGILTGEVGFEPTTRILEIPILNQLNYTPLFIVFFYIIIN